MPIVFWTSKTVLSFELGMNVKEAVRDNFTTAGLLYFKLRTNWLSNEHSSLANERWIVYYYKQSSKALLQS